MNKPVVRKVRLSVPAASGLCPAAPSPDGSGFARPAFGGLHPQREHDLHDLHEVGDLLLREAGLRVEQQAAHAIAEASRATVDRHARPCALFDKNTQNLRNIGAEVRQHAFAHRPARRHV